MDAGRDLRGLPDPSIDPRLQPPVVIVPGFRPRFGPPGPERFYDPLNVIPPFARRIIDRYVP
jgi:hypothetical protein